MVAKYILFVALIVTLVTVVGAGPASRGGAGRAVAPSGPPPGIERVKLWEKTPGVVEGPEAEGNPTEPTMDIYLPPVERATGAAIVILPGGGYTNVAVPNEGTATARKFLESNIATFVVRYRHAPRYHQPTPLLDAQRAIRTVRARAEQYHIDPQRIGILGFSAGGHLAASASTMFSDGPKPENPDAVDALSARPDFAILMYPVINFTDDAVAHKGSRDALTNRDPSLYALLSPEQHVAKETPPTFLVHGTNDRTVPVMNSILYYQACLKAGVPAEMHIFENGPHGFGVGANDPALRTWPEMVVTWMTRHKWIANK